MALEKKFWENKVKLLENAENIRYVFSSKKRKNISFYEGFAILLSEGYLKPGKSNGEHERFIN